MRGLELCAADELTDHPDGGLLRVGDGLPLVASPLVGALSQQKSAKEKQEQHSPPKKKGDLDIDQIPGEKPIFRPANIGGGGRIERNFYRQWLRISKVPTVEGLLDLRRSSTGSSTLAGDRGARRIPKLFRQCAYGRRHLRDTTGQSAGTAAQLLGAELY
jgi:hypothetical protein